MSASTTGAGGSLSNLSLKWGWFVILGIVLIVMGVIAWLDVVAVTIASTFVIGAALLVGGAFQIVHAFMTREWRGFIFSLLSGVLYFIGGLLIMNEPMQGAIVLTILVAATVIVGGIVRVVLALRERHIRAWGLVLISGLVSVAVGCLIYLSLPWSGLWVLGTLIAVELLVQGGGWLYFGVALRAARRTLSGPKMSAPPMG
ncbi:MAG: HdeD family acid-resistance protein [Acetobacteraceae bacterium]